MKHENVKLRYVSAALLILVFLTSPLITLAYANDQGVIHFTEDVDSGKPVGVNGVTVTAPPGKEMGECPGAGASYTAIFDIYLMNELGGPNSVSLTAFSSADAVTYTNVVTINQVTYMEETGTATLTPFTDSTPPTFVVGG
jgi:hypothetical protein